MDWEEFKDRFWKACKGASGDYAESVDEVREVMKDFELEDEAMIFDASADMSVVWFNLYVERKKQVWMKLIEIYNADDLKATRSLVDWFFFMQEKDA